MSNIATADEITAQTVSQSFKNYDGCFLLYSVNEHKIISEYNPDDRCKQRLSPDSTFKIALSLMAFNQGIITQKTVFKWNGGKGVLPEHEHNQTAHSWLKYSVVWVSQQLTPKLGYARIENYLAGFEYGNKDFSGDPGKNNGLTHAWLSSSLKISALEQLHFLNAMLTNELPLHDRAIVNTQKNLYQGKLANGAAYYGKTGSGRHGLTGKDAQLRDGWFVGFIESGTQRYIFVSNLTDKAAAAPTDKSYGGQLMKPITLSLLNQYFTR